MYKIGGKSFITLWILLLDRWCELPLFIIIHDPLDVWGEGALRERISHRTEAGERSEGDSVPARWSGIDIAPFHNERLRVVENPSHRVISGDRRDARAVEEPPDRLLHDGISRMAWSSKH